MVSMFQVVSVLTGRAETVIVGQILVDGVRKVEKIVPLVLVDHLDRLLGLATKKS